MEKKTGHGFVSIKTKCALEGTVKLPDHGGWVDHSAKEWC